MDQCAALLQRMHEAAPPGQRELDPATRRTLAELTAALVAARPESMDEFRLYMDTRQRSLDLPDAGVRARLAGRTIVVTGGSGCLGTALCRQLGDVGAARITSVSVTPPARPVPGVRYIHLDIRDSGALERLFRDIGPELVFHLAAQRDPGLAEREVSYTIGSNLIGTRNVVQAAGRAGVKLVVHASTGKALRPYTRDIYAASKRASEWVVARAAARGVVPCAVVRFTHVVDNAIFLARLAEWCRREGVIRLHSADAAFYAQSALESAQLMLCAALAPRDDVTRIHAIRDLGWPISALALALGMIMDMKTIVPIYLAGYEPGYESRPYPGLFDPSIAGSVSPLVNAFEASRVEPIPDAAPDATIDCVAMLALGDPRADKLIALLEELCRSATHDDVLRAALDDLSSTLLHTSLRATAPATLRRVVALTEPYRDEMDHEHLLLDDIVRRWAGVDEHSLATAEVQPTRLAQTAPSQGLGWESR